LLEFGIAVQANPMLTTQQKVTALLNDLPDDCTIEDIQYRLYVLTKITTGLKAADTEEHHPPEQQLGKWLIP
jgi:hypothetical protein